MSIVWNRTKHQKKHELVKSHSQTQLLANKLRQEGVMGIIEEIMQGVEQVATLLAQPTFDPKLSYKDSIFNLCQYLKIYGSYLEMLFEDQLNRAFIIFRNSSQDERIDQNSRLYLLELIELRAKRWKGSDQMNHYYKKKIETCESTSNLSESLLSGGPSTISVSPPLLNPGEILKASGKFAKPTKITGKNYCKDEVVIRNADSGKVMGIKGRRVHMIEELSETIISFQRVNPGAKERLVQITGANEESINHSKQLIEDTIRRNASPVRDLSMAFGGGGGGGCSSAVTGSTSSINSSASDDGFLPISQRSAAAAASSDRQRQSRLLHSLSTNDAHIGEYKFTVVHPNGSTLKIIGDNLDLVRISKLVLDDYFSGEPLPEMEPFYDFENLPKSMENISFIPTIISPSSLLTNGKEEDDVTLTKDEESSQYVPLRQPRKSVDEIMNGKTSASTSATISTNIRKNIEKMICYSIEYLARIAMSPLCLTPPIDWNRINQDYPMIVRKVAESFDANQYLSTRSGDLHTLPNVDDIDISDI